MYMQKLPPNVTKYFWGDDLNELNLNDHQDYIIQTLLDNGDEHAIRWLLRTYCKNDLYEMLPRLKLSPRSANFWNIYLQTRILNSSQS